MRLAVVLVTVVGVARAEPAAPRIDVFAFAEYAVDGVNFAPLERPLPISLAEVNGELRLTATLTKLFDASAYHDLGNGLTATIAVHVIVARAGSDKATEIRQIRRSVRYDQWDERYTIRLDDRAPLSVKRKADALQQMTTLDDVPIAPLVDLPRGEITLELVAELNPASERARAEVQGWVPGSMFGTLVSLFVDPSQDGADRVLRVRSAPIRL